MSEIDKSLERLDPSVRTRVEAALKATLEAELAKAGLGGIDNPAAVFSRSKGWVFSRSKTSDMLRDPPELLENVAGMDDRAFTAFAQRLSKLKSMKDVQK